MQGKGAFDYIASAYFVIVSFSTIGYGDIFPTDWFSRMFQDLLIVINITVMSSFLSNFTNLLYQISSYDKTYEFNNHVVIIGEY